ncbi:MAG: MBL fold metallo-hydrolase [Clostridia bacterium]|nr:MBL fold metallo-hydrolase [Clostridia bacterium]
MMRLRVIGTGSSGNAYLLTDVGYEGQESDALLLDAGVNIKRITKTLYGIRPAPLIGALITHEHGDHASAVKDLSRLGVPCFGTPGTAEAVGHGMKAIAPYIATEVGKWLIMPFRTNHDAAQPCGFLINSLRTGERLIYATDTYYLSHKYPGVNYWLIECNYCEECLTEDTPPQLLHRLRESHMSLDRLCTVFRDNDLKACKKIILCHTSQERGNRQLMLQRVSDAAHKPVVVAEPGQTYNLNIDPF